MLALHVWFHPQILQGKKIITDPYSNEFISQSALFQAYNDNKEVLNLLYDIDNGIVHISLAEYLRLSSGVKTALRLYRSVKNEYEVE